MYTRQNFKTKKALKDALSRGETVYVFSPGLGTVPENGTVFLEGPSFEMHTWYAEGKMKDGKLVSVK